MDKYFYHRIGGLQMIQRPRLLIIDDDPMIQQLLTMHLRKDFFIFSANGGQEGFALAHINRPDIVTLDMQMPGWDGIKTLQAFRANRKLSNIPVLILSAETEKAAVIRAIQAGANDYLIKDGSWHEKLVARLNRLLSPEEVPAVPKPAPQPALAMAPAEWNQAVADLAGREAMQNFEDGF